MHPWCVGCENQGRPRAVGNGRTRGKSDGGIDAGEAGGGEPPRRVSGGRCARSRPHRCGRRSPTRCGARCAKRSAGARARAETRARRFVYGAVPEPVRGAAGTGEARGAARDEAEASPAAGAAGEGERGEVPDERGAQRRREETTAVRRTMRSNMATGVPVRQRRGAKRAAGQAERAVSEANGGARDTRPKGRDRAAGSAG